MSARILVVDDVEANVRLLEAKLTAEYYEVITASDGATALVKAAELLPDIILLDNHMPGVQGIDALAGTAVDVVKVGVMPGAGSAVSTGPASSVRQ